MPSEAIASWNHAVGDFQFSTEEFYKLVEEKIQEREIPDVKFKQRNIRQGGMFSKNRLYLEVKRKDYIFHICAAPFGKSYFFSWYLREKLSRWQELITRIPVLGPVLVKNMELKSYYQIDTANMFKGSIHDCVVSVMEEILEPKGYRLSEHDRRVGN